jgi:PilZ domain
MPSHTLAAGDLTPAPPPRNCRVYERKECELPSTCRPASVTDAAEVRWSATIRDISQGGVRLMVGRRFEKGTGLAVELAGDFERDSTIVFAKVVHLRRHESGAWLLGCKFLSALSEDEVQRLLTSPHPLLTSNKSVHSEEDGAV